MRTHEVGNQAPPIGDYNLFEADRAMVEAVNREGVRRVVETELSDSELAGLREAAEAVRAKQADVADL